MYKQGFDDAGVNYLILRKTMTHNRALWFLRGQVRRRWADVNALTGKAQTDAAFYAEGFDSKILQLQQTGDPNVT